MRKSEIQKQISFQLPEGKIHFIQFEKCPNKKIYYLKVASFVEYKCESYKSKQQAIKDFMLIQELI